MQPHLDTQPSRSTLPPAGRQAYRAGSRWRRPEARWWLAGLSALTLAAVMVTAMSDGPLAPLWRTQHDALATAADPFAATDTAATSSTLKPPNPPQLAWAGAASTASANQPFTFAAIGDTPYSQREERFLREVFNDITVSGANFIVHIGDIKSGGEPCSDELLQSRRDLLDEAGVPLVLVPGDNEWTDCHRSRAGAFEPRERLQRLRDMMFASDRSLGAEPLKLARQSDLAGYRQFRENSRWEHNGIVFVTLNIPGSNNNWQSDAGRNGEFDDRMLANKLWLRKTVEYARSHKAAGLVISFHANPDFEERTKVLTPQRSPLRDGYLEFKQMLRDAAEQFDGAILLIHGDTHMFRIDQPLRHRDGQIIKNITRLEVFGSPFAEAWVRVRVDPAGPIVFQASPKRAVPIQPAVN